MNTLTRRTALAVPITLPLLPLAALATPADPAVEAYHAWRAAHDAYAQSFQRPHVADNDPLMNAAGDVEFAARGVMSDAVATTPAGLAYQIRFALGVFGSPTSNDVNIDDPDDFEFPGWADDLERRLFKSMLSGSERMAA